jgi:hypothetical protein
MKAEKLLRDIKDLLVKHESFLNQNPEMFFAIEERLMKAVDPDDEDEWQPEGDENYKDEDEDSDANGLGLFDDEQGSDDEEEPSYDDEDEAYVNSGKEPDEDDEAAKWLKENDASSADEEPSYSDDDLHEDEQPQLDLDSNDALTGGFQKKHLDAIKDMPLDEAKKYLKEQIGKSPGIRDNNRKELLGLVGLAQSPESLKAMMNGAMLAHAKSTLNSNQDQKKSSGRMTEWKPKDSYHPDHDAKIKDYVSQGYSPREAERLAGAHQAPTNFYDALRGSTRPSDPSPKMLETMKGLSHEWLRNADRKTSESAEADVNPQKYASAKVLAAHDAAHKDFTTAHNDFLASDEMKGVSGRERHAKIAAWKKKWNEENPEHREAAVNAAASGKALADANQARKQRLQEGTASLLTAGFNSGEDNPMAGEFSSGAAGETPETRGMQSAAQSVGAEQDDENGGFQANIKKDPNLVFAEKNKAYIDNLKSKLQTKMAPEQAERMKAIDSFKAPKKEEE